MDPKIEKEILESIEMGGGRLMPERVICADVRRALGDEITDELVMQNIETLRSLGEIEADIAALEGEIAGLLKGLVA